MSIMVSPLVKAEIRKRFSESDAVEAVALLDRDLPLLEPGRGRDRVHLAILICSGGDLAKFRTAVRVAGEDWRDILMAAGLGNANWPEVLREKGYGVPED